MSVLDDFFGDSETAVEECSLCECRNGLTVTVSDAYGPTHWICEACKAEQNKKTIVKTIDNSDESQIATVTITVIGEESQKAKEVTSSNNKALDEANEVIDELNNHKGVLTMQTLTRRTRNLGFGYTYLPSSPPTRPDHEGTVKQVLEAIENDKTYQAHRNNYRTEVWFLNGQPITKIDGEANRDFWNLSELADGDVDSLEVETE